MKFLVILIVAFGFGMSAYAQDPEQDAPEKPDMTLVGQESGKTLHVEDKKKQEKKHSVSKSKKKHTEKREGK